MVARWIPLQPPTHGLEEGEGAGGCMVITGLQPKCHRADQQPLEPLPSFYTDLPEATELFCRLQLREPQYAALDKILQVHAHHNCSSIVCRDSLNTDSSH